MILTVRGFLGLIPEDEILGISDNTLSQDSVFTEKILSSVSIDSRTVQENSVFFAVMGEKLDGHSFLSEVSDKGALICIGSKSVDELAIETPQITVPARFLYVQVKEVEKVLLMIARAYREQYIKNTCIIGVTGSAGKTTTKDMITGAIGKLNPSSTVGNFNNHFGLPLSILKINQNTAVAVLEAGMNHRGEIARLAEIMQPDVVVITNIGTAHIEYLKTQEEIAFEKSDLAKFSPRSKLLIIPQGEPFLPFIQKNISDKSDKIKIIESEIQTEPKMQLSIPGAHMIQNAWLAFQTAKSTLALLKSSSEFSKALVDNLVGNIESIKDEDIVNGIGSASLPPRRMQVFEFPNNITVIDDSYNANPDSMKAGLNVVEKYQDSTNPGTFIRKIVILGKMAELGDQSKQFHNDILEYTLGLPSISDVYLIAPSDNGFNTLNFHQGKIKTFASQEECIAVIKAAIKKDFGIMRKESDNAEKTGNTLLFIKGSKSSDMGVIADALCEFLGN